MLSSSNHIFQAIAISKSRAVCQNIPHVAELWLYCSVISYDFVIFTKLNQFIYLFLVNIALTKPSFPVSVGTNSGEYWATDEDVFS